MTEHEIVLKPHPESGYRLLLDGHDLSEIVKADGVTLGWDNGRPVVTITVMPHRVRLEGVAAEVVEGLMTVAPEKPVSND